MLTRLSDRFDQTPDGEKKVVRYGMWGTSDEIERHGKKYIVVHSDKRKKDLSFHRRCDAELYLLERVKL